MSRKVIVHNTFLLMSSWYVCELSVILSEYKAHCVQYTGQISITKKLPALKLKQSSDKKTSQRRPYKISYLSKHIFKTTLSQSDSTPNN